MNRLRYQPTQFVVPSNREGGPMSLSIKDIIPSPPVNDSWRDKLGDLPWDSFCAVSLLNWLDAARRAGITIVPATEVWRGPVLSLLLFDVQEGDHIKDLTDLYATLKRVGAQRTMFRWDCCASYDVKFHLADGDPEWSEDYLRLPVDDPRAFDLLFEYPRREMIVWQRPWVQATIHNNYPVEFRVFVKDGVVIGVSNYYPQMALPDSYSDMARHAMELTSRLIEHVQTPVWVPHDGGAARWAQDKVHGTVDWLMTDAGELLFLEGGPPFGAGAHPCCFLDAEKIEGVALAAQKRSDQ